MENKLGLIFKSFIVEASEIIPRVVVGLIAVSLGIYEKSIECISNFFKDVRNNPYFSWINWNRCLFMSYSKNADYYIANK